MLIGALTIVVLIGCPPRQGNYQPQIFDFAALEMPVNGFMTIDLAGYAQYGGPASDLSWSVSDVDSDYLLVRVENNMLAINSFGLAGQTWFNLILTSQSGLYDQQWIEVAVNGGQPAEYFNLTAEASPANGGAVSPESGQYQFGEIIYLTAQAAEGWEFNHWEGYVSDAYANPTRIDIYQDSLVQAVFLPSGTIQQYFLSASVSPANAGSVSPASGLYDEGTTITLTAAANAGFVFDHWVGNVANSGQNQAWITLYQDESVQAIFVPGAATQKYSLSTSVSPSGAGSVSPASGLYDAWTTITLTAAANSGFVFDHWVGNVSDAGSNPTEIALSQNESVQAVFAPKVKQISFAGRQWFIKASETRADPGQNFFSGAADNVWVNGSGLNLALRYRDNKYYCSEVYLDRSLGFGAYFFSLSGRVDLLDPNLVLGCFTWADPQKAIWHKEFDFEFTKWGDPNNATNAQFAINPFYLGMVQRYLANLPDSAPELTCYLVWQPMYVEFRTYAGRYALASLPPAANLIRSWRYDRETIPAPSDESFRFNLWLNNNLGPSDGQEAVATVSDFGWQSAVPAFPVLPPANPAIEITYLPPAGSANYLQGKAYGVDFSTHRVVAYIKVSGVWWIKPYLDQPLTAIDQDGAWSCDVETDPGDVGLTEVLVHLIPAAAQPPLCLPCDATPAVTGSLAQATAAR